MSVTLADIAKRTGLSISAVSAALKGNRSTAKVSSEVQAKVLASAKSLGYRPSHMARALKTGRTNVIGLVAGEIHSPYYGEIVTSLVEIAELRGYSVQMHVTRWDYHRCMDFIRSFADGRCDGAILLEIAPPDCFCSEIIGGGLPLLAINTESVVLPKVQVDWRPGFDELAADLSKKRIRDAAFLGLHVEIDKTRRKLLDLKASFSSAGIELRMFESDESMELSLRRGFELASSKALPGAVVCENEVTALALMRGLLSGGSRVPEDLLAYSCDDTFLSSYAQPSLSSIGFDKRLLAETAISKILGMIEKDPQAQSSFLIPTRLTCRESSQGSFSGHARCKASRNAHSDDESKTLRKADVE